MTVGSQIGSYKIEHELGHGGFGVVYVGVDVRLGRRAAIKQLLPELSSNHEIVERFFNEAKAAANINHPGIVEIYDVGWHTDGSAYFAMKLLEGESLGKRLRKTGPLPVALACTIARQVASALVAAHQRQIVHRDLKPDNIVLVPDDEVVIGERATVLDFGIAKLFGGTPLSHKTRTGMMMGTPLYMSPEQCRGAGEVDHRTDVYALGCILFEMLTGRAPFTGEGAGEILGMHQFVEPPTVRSLRPDVPPELDALVARTLAKKPADRFQQMTELTTALGAFATGGRASAERSTHLPAASAAMPQQTPQPTPAPTPPHLLHAAQNVTTANAPSTFTAARGEVSAPTRGRSKLPLAIGAGVLGVGAIVVIALAATTSSKSTAPADAPVVAVAADARPIVEPMSIDAAAEDCSEVTCTLEKFARPCCATYKPVDGGPPAVTGVVTLERECGAARTTKNWTAVEECAHRLEKLDAAKAKPLLDLAATEMRAEVNARQLSDQIKDKNLAAARATLARIPPSSVYFAESKAKLQRAEQEARAKDPKWDPNALFVKKEPCASCPTGTKCENKKCVTIADATCDADALADSADALLNQGSFAAALAKYETSLACKHNPRLFTKAYLAACRARNADKARHYYQLTTRGALRQICLKEGIEVEK